MNRVNVQPEAHAEAERVAEWYEEQRADLGVEFVLELDLAIERAAENPEGYATQYREVRRVLLRRFPYAVYFVYEAETLIRIQAFLRRCESESFSRTSVELSGDGIASMLSDVSHVRAFRDVLTDQPVCVLVGPALP